MLTQPFVAVDDSRVELELLAVCHVRSRIGNELVVFDDPLLVLDHMRLAEAGQRVTPALLLIDIRMPQMDGFELVQHLQREFEALPRVALFTTSAHPDDALRARELGVDFHTKPTGLVAYTDFIRRLADDIEAR